MTRAVTTGLFLLVGIGIGTLFFGGLWLTVRALPTTRYPTALAVVSFWGRTALVVAAFTFVFSTGWRNVLVCLVGFLAARLLMSRWIPKATPARRAVE